MTRRRAHHKCLDFRNPDSGISVASSHAPRAREAYLVALFRARDQRSFTGVLRAQEAFETLGDRPVALQCLHIAGSMPGIGAVEQGIARERLDRLAAFPHSSWNAR